MTPLLQQMIEAMQQRGFSERTHKSYLRAVQDLARYYHRTPALLNVDDLQAYFKYLACERLLSGSPCVRIVVASNLQLEASKNESNIHPII